MKPQILFVVFSAFFQLLTVEAKFDIADDNQMPSVRFEFDIVKSIENMFEKYRTARDKEVIEIQNKIYQKLESVFKSVIYKELLPQLSEICKNNTNADRGNSSTLTKENDKTVIEKELAGTEQRIKQELMTKFEPIVTKNDLQEALKGLEERVNTKFQQILDKLDSKDSNQVNQASDLNQKIAALEQSLSVAKNELVQCDKDKEMLVKRLNEADQGKYNMTQSKIICEEQLKNYQNGNVSFCTNRTQRQEGKYLGCYEDLVFERAFRGYANILGATNSKENCCKICRARNFVYCANENDWCLCGNTAPQPNLNKKLADSSCDWICKGNTTQKCGGAGKMSVYESGITQYLFNQEGRAVGESTSDSDQKFMLKINCPGV